MDTILRATNWFDQGRSIGKGNFGDMYKGFVQMEFQEVAIKVMGNDYMHPMVQE